MARGDDGRWTALDGTAIYEHAKAGGFVYEAHLRHAVRERVAWAQWGAVRNGIAELEQVPVEVREEFSTRRRRILEREAELAAEGVSVGHKGREKIVFDTREAKKEVDERDWRANIRARAAEHGLGPEELEALASLPHAKPAPDVSPDQLSQLLFASSGLTAMRNTFHDRDVVIGVAESFQQGAPAGRVLEVAREMAREPEAVAIPSEQDRRYTTRELLDAERQLVDHARAGRGQNAAVLNPDQVKETLGRLPRALSGEQQQAVRAIATGGHRVDTVEALAGTGKTTSANALREVYERAGYRVVGAAPTGRAVRELKERAGIRQSLTLDSWALKLAADPTAMAFATVTSGGVRRQPGVLIIDEAGMAHTRLSSRVIDQALAADLKVVAIGDSGQLSSVQAGGWLGALTRELGSHELREVMRQRDGRERRLLAHVHRGEPDAYLQLKQARGELVLFAGEHPGVDAETAIIDQWASEAERLGVGEAVIISRDNDRRERLNELARRRLLEHGKLGQGVELAGREWAVGDRVIARRNDRGRDLDNGMRGTIIHADQDREQLLMRADAGGARALDLEYIERHLEHAYALTGHGMQGGTVTWAGVIGHPGDFSRNWSYTALSRAREPTRIYLVDEPSRSQQQREDIAPAGEPAEDRDVLWLMSRRMRERDDEDLALEALEYAQQEQEQQQEHEQADDPGQGHANEQPDRDQAAAASEQPTPASEEHAEQAGHEPDHDQAAESAPPRRDVAAAGDVAPRAAAPEISTTLARVYELDEQLAELGEQLRAPAIADARELIGLDQTIAGAELEHQRDRAHKPAGRHDRSAHQARLRQREQNIAQLRAQRAQLRDRVPDPDLVLQHADRLAEQRARLRREQLALRARAVDEQLASQPPWLQQTLGPEPHDRYLAAAWQQAARQTAGWRIDHHITNPDVAFGPDPGDASYRTLRRTIEQTRSAIDLEHDLNPTPAAETEHRHDDPGACESPSVSPLRERVYELKHRLAAIAEQLQAPEIEDARAITRLQETIGAVEQEHQRDRKPSGWRDRSGHQTRVRQREQQLAELRAHQDELLDRTPDPPSVLARAETLRDQQKALMDQSHQVRTRAIEEELAARPPWLARTLGPEPTDAQLRSRWHKAARETAGYRINHQITDPQTGLGPDPGADNSYRVARRTIIDTRRALGLDHDRDRGVDLDAGR
ncbi:MAG: AAA family ATPase [Solirubrobacteraceae bacterium]